MWYHEEIQGDITYSKEISHRPQIWYHLILKWYLWNAKLTETQIFRELSIEIESSLFNWRALYLIIDLSNSNRELSYSNKELSNTTYPIRELFNWIIELFNWIIELCN